MTSLEPIQLPTQSKAKSDQLPQQSDWPRRERYTPSPISWRDEVFYFLLPDRFSDGRETPDRLLDRTRLDDYRPSSNGVAWDFGRWAESGARRWQGGTLKGIKSKLGYLATLGVTVLWIAPVFRQRTRADSYHGYAIQNFLEVDPRFGTCEDLVDLIDAAHAKGMWVILDIVFNHTGPNWVYPNDEWAPGYRLWPDHYLFGRWLDGNDRPEDGAHPRELQDPEVYTRAGMGSPDKGSVDDAHAEHKRSDFDGFLRDIATDKPDVLNMMARCYKYWIALTDCDGFRLDTVKHVGKEEARNFCGAIKEFATTLGKERFFLLGEVAGGDENQHRYIDALDRNIDAVLDIGNMRPTLTAVAKGLCPPSAYFAGFGGNPEGFGSHRLTGDRHVLISDDHDLVSAERKLRFSAEISDTLSCKAYQVAAATAIQLYSLGIPCIYYGTEQALGGPEGVYHGELPSWGVGKWADRYLREAMFGPLHPRPCASCHDMATQLSGADDLPGFGPFGTAGAHCFDVRSPAFVRIRALIALRAQIQALRSGRQYPRALRQDDRWDFPKAGQVVAWSRILEQCEILCVVNANGESEQGGSVVVDANLNAAGASFIVVLNTAEVAASSRDASYTGPHPVGSSVLVQRTSPSEPAHVDLSSIAPAEVIVLWNGK
jgi:glycosidase